jgi:hypothetical protein
MGLYEKNSNMGILWIMGMVSSWVCLEYGYGIIMIQTYRVYYGLYYGI